MTSSPDPFGYFPPPSGPPTYPDSGTSAAYSPYPPIGYPVGYPVGYQLVPLVPVGPRRPGTAIASAVLQFVQSGFVLIGAFWLLFVGSVGETFRVRSGADEATGLGVAALLAFGLLIAGGVMVLSGRVAMTVLACLVSLGISAYFVVRMAGTLFSVAISGFGTPVRLTC